MTVSSTINKITYLGDGTNRTFNIPFYVLKEADLSFVLINIETSEETYITSDYSVQAINYTFPSDTCELTYPIIASPMPEGYKLIIIRTVDIQQTTEFKQNASLQPKVVEQALDKQAMAMQQLEEEISRCIKASLASEVEPEELITELLGITATAAGYASAAQASATQTSADVVTAAASVVEAQAIVDGLDFATQAEAEAGTVSTKVMSPLTVKQAIDANPAAPTIATQAEAEAGTNNTKMVTPLRSLQAITALAPKISITTGTITGGGTIPLPSGYTRGQCQYMVSMADVGAKEHWTSVNQSTGQVDCRDYYGVRLANYMCIAIK